MSATLAERIPPHNFEAEQALIGAILLDGSIWQNAAEIVQPSHFADPLHGRLFEMLGRMVERGQVVSAFTLKTYAESDEGLKAAGGSGYIARLAAASVHASDALAAARVVRDCAMRRRLIAVLNDAMPAAYDAGDASPAELIERVERGLYDVAEGTTTGDFQPFRVGLTAAVNTAAAAHSRPGGVAGVSTGFADIDDLLCGLQRSDLVVLAGRPGMGKSALASNIGFHAAQQVPVGIFSLEMSSEQWANRILSEQAGVSAKLIREGKLTSRQIERVQEVGAQLEALPMFLDESPAHTVASMRSRARRLKRAHGLGLLIVDYLQLMTGTGKRNDNRVQEVSEITRGLKAIAKELDVPVLALSQLSRDVEKRSDKKPQLADLRDSGSIEQDADVVAFIYREEYYLQSGDDADRQKLLDAHGIAELIVAKHRHGPTGTIRLRFDGPTTRFTDWSAA